MINFNNATKIEASLLGAIDPILGEVIDLFEGDEHSRPWIEFDGGRGISTFYPSWTYSGTHYAAYSEGESK